MYLCDQFKQMELKKKIVIAVDGFSSCGKSSYAKLIAHELNYIYIDSGAMYRAIALYALRKDLVSPGRAEIDEVVKLLPEINVSFTRKHDELFTLLNGENVEKEIRGAEVSSIVSEISKIKEVRSHMVKLQRKMGEEKGIVMDGRDIGTVVFPEAEIKIYMQANLEVRAKRRFDELKQKGIAADLDDIRKNIQERDYQDMHRSESPLLLAEDARVLDNSNMTFDEQMQWFFAMLKEKNLIIA